MESRVNILMSNQLDTRLELKSRTPKPSELNPDLYNASINAIVDRVTSVFHRLHVLVVGPGLSRDKALLDSAKKIIGKAREHGMPIVLDAVGLNGNDGSLIALARC